MTQPSVETRRPGRAESPAPRKSVDGVEGDGENSACFNSDTAKVAQQPQPPSASPEARSSSRHSSLPWIAASVAVVVVGLAVFLVATPYGGKVAKIVPLLPGAFVQGVRLVPRLSALATIAPSLIMGAIVGPRRLCERRLRTAQIAAKKKSD
mmetsp:Transcript_79054/g.228560  ORF Transcript_79054/g.228560 Transcript_79054/m.228560 type:complete len:152 (-) Transcript_79054:96-551(-)